MDKIKFGTDGWRAIIAQDYTVNNVKRVTQALGSWLKEKHDTPLVVVGYDCRFGGEMFAKNTAMLLCDLGIKVYLSKSFCSTPMVSYAVKELNAHQGVVITASHNPANYNGYKLKGQHGGPSSVRDIEIIESMVKNEIPELKHDFNYYINKKLIEIVDLEEIYISYLRSKFDISKLADSGIKIAYDAMYGAGQNVIRRLLPNAVLLHCEVNPSFKGVAPEPIHKNLQEFSQLIKDTPEVKMGLATDGDADRIGLYDEFGNFIDAHHIILLLIHYMVKYKNMSGKVVVAFSVTEKIRKLCEYYGLELEVTKIGFKHISEKMVAEDVLLGGEESGGIAVKGHIPERDGIFDGLMIYEFMVETGKSINALIEEVYDIVGPFVYDRLDMTLAEEKKQNIIKNANNDVYNKGFGPYEVAQVQKTDGVKYLLTDGSWVMLRASGTEPLLRIYVESNSKEAVEKLLEEVKKTIL